MKLGKSFVIVTLFSLLLLGGCNKSSSTGYKKYVDALTSALETAKDYRGPMTVTGAMRDQMGDFVESGTNVDTVDPDTNRWCQTLSGWNYDLMEPAEEEYLGHLYNFNGESYKVRDVSTRTYTEKNSYCSTIHDDFNIYVPLHAYKEKQRNSLIDYIKFAYIPYFIEAVNYQVGKEDVDWKYLINHDHHYAFDLTYESKVTFSNDETYPYLNFLYTLRVEWDQNFVYKYAYAIRGIKYTDKTTSTIYETSIDYTFNPEFDSETYNSVLDNIHNHDFTPTSADQNYIHFMARNCDMTIAYYYPNQVVDLNNIKEYMSNNRHLNVKGFYYDEDLTAQIDTLKSTKEVEYIYMDVEAEEGYVLYKTIRNSDKTIMNRDTMSEFLFDILFPNGRRETYYDLIAYEVGYNKYLPWGSVPCNTKFISATYDGKPYYNETVEITNDKEMHVFEFTYARSLDWDGYDMNKPTPLDEICVANNDKGIILRSFAGAGYGNPYYVINTKDIVKQNFALTFSDYTCDHFMIGDELNTATLGDKSGVNLEFYINGEKVTELPKNYEGDIVIKTTYDGDVTLHYLLIG